MKKRRISGYATLLIIIMLFTGCSHNNDSIETKETNMQTEAISIEISTEVSEHEGMTQFPTEYIMEDGKVKFSTEVIAGTNGIVEPLFIYQAEPIKVVHDKIYDAFFAQTELKNTQILDRKNEDGSMGTAYYYHGTAGESLSILETSFRYYSQFAFQVLNSFSLEKGQDGYNADLYQTNKDFLFLNHEDAEREILEQMKSIGLELGNDDYQYQYYSLDYATLEKEENILNMDGNQDIESYKDGWSEEDNCYYFCIRQKKDGIPIAYEFANAFSEYNDGNAPVQAMISRDGLKMLAMDRWFQLTKTSEQAILLDFEQIASRVTDKFGDLLTETIYDVKRAELIFWVFKDHQGEYTMKPVWIFDVMEQAEGMEQGYLLQMMIDAQTGEEIVL